MVEYSEGAAFWVRILVLVPALFLGAAGAYYWLGLDRGKVVPREAPAAAEPPGEEARRLAACRREIEEETPELAEALARLGSFLATSQDPRSARLALEWKEALEGAAESRTYRVRWRGYVLEPGSYRKRVHTLLEPGLPDVYLRVYRQREGKEELVFDGSRGPAAGWSGRWAGESPEAPSFALEWRAGDGLRVELREKDLLGDDLLGARSREGGLSLFLVSTAWETPEGHRVELESDFGFGRGSEPGNTRF